LKRKTSVEVAGSQLGGDWLSIYAPALKPKKERMLKFSEPRRKKKEKEKRKRKRRKKNGRWKDIRSLGSTDDCRR